MKEYNELAQHVLENGISSENRTGTDRLSVFNYNYTVDISEKFPLLTTKKVNFNAVVHELLWLLSGDDHIRNLKEHTKIWNEWADENDNLETAYGRYWRHYPVSNIGMLDHEAKSYKYTSVRKGNLVLDQIAYVIDSLKELKMNPSHPSRNRLIVSAWHPFNACESKLPPCHYTFCFNIFDGRLNCHLTQRSGDIALGIPFNIASYSLLTMIIARLTGYEVGSFGHTIIDAHIYQDHIEGLKKQLTRSCKELPTVTISDDISESSSIDDVLYEHIQLHDYDPHTAIKFKVSV